MSSPNDVPRRIQLEKMVPAELVILNAVEEVEKLPADERLTDAVTLLAEARERVADFIDEVPRVEEAAPKLVHEPLVMFLYLLLRDRLSAGKVEALVAQVEAVGDKEMSFSNAYLAMYAREIVKRLGA